MTFRTLLERLSEINGFVDNTAHMKINVPQILQSKDKRVRLYRNRERITNFGRLKSTVRKVFFTELRLETETGIGILGKTFDIDNFLYQNAVMSN